MKSLLLIVPLLAFLTSVAAFSAEEVIEKEWELFKKEHKKIYSEMEEIFRKKVFIENKHRIAAHNLRYQRGVHSYKLRMNEFGDLMHHEFVRIMNGLKREYHNSTASGNGIEFMRPHFFKAPESVDWREHGYVTPVKNQGHCGSCWSFSATGSLEGQHFRKTGRLVSLSEQNLIDCSESYGNNGCNGGLMDQAFQYIKDNHGVDTEKFYPYEAQDGTCRYSKRGRGATDKGFVDIVPRGDEDQLKHAVASVGPISVAIDASHESFQFYSEGIYDEPDCSPEDLDHGVLVVGYGSDSDQDYWIVKNSWGPTWGDSGYVRMSRNKGNQCGIASQASYPLV